MFSSNTSQVSDDKLFVEDCFSCFLYQGNGSTQTITNGIDLAGKGGLVWMKSRSGAAGNMTYDTVSGATLRTDGTGANSGYAPTYINSTSSGFYIDAAAGGGFNASSTTYASWTFRKAPKFFDVVTYTGNGSVRTIAHSLGVAPGCIIIKDTGDTGNWWVYHRSTGNNFRLFLNTTDAAGGNGSYLNSTDPTATNFTLGANTSVNNNGSTYVAYLFAHDTTSDGIIQCGSFTTNSSGDAPAVNLGWEPQWILWKSSSATGNWQLLDTMRGWNNSGTNDNKALYADLSNAEGNVSQGPGPNPTGFTMSGNPSNTYIYIAIRRGPMRTPTSGTSVFSPIAASNVEGTKNTTGFTVDLQINRIRSGAYSTYAIDRLRGVSATASNGGQDLKTNTTDAERSNTLSKFWDNTGFQTPYLLENTSLVYWNFRRAPSFMDTVCYTGTGVARTINHNLGVAPEMMIVKRRTGSTGYWNVYAAPLGATKLMFMNLADAPYNSTGVWNTAPTSTQFSLLTDADVNASGGTYVAYLFASCPGVSKVGGYTGNGSSQTINCGFAAGARFVMIKRTDSTGSWWVWDTARGLVSGNDPALQLNSTAAETTGIDSIDPDSSGFIVNQDTTTNINVSSGTYVYLAIS